MSSTGVNRSFKTTIAHSILWTVLGRSSGMVTSFVVFVTLAHLLTLSQFGLFALASVFVDITRVIATSGWSDVIVRDPDQDRELLDTAFWASLGLGVVVAGAAVLLARPYGALIDQPDVAPIITVLAPLVPFSCLATVPIGRLLHTFGYKAVAVRTSISGLVAGLAAMVAAAAGWGVWSLVVQAVVADVINVGSAWMVAPVARPGLSFSWRRWWQLSGFTLNVLGAQLMWLLLIRVSELFIARDLGAAAVGAYRIAFRLFELIGQAILSPVAAVALPALSRLEGDHQRLSAALSRIIGLLSIGVFPLMAGFGATGDIVVPIVFGAKWAAAVPVTQILMLLMVPFLVSFFEGAVFAAVGRTSALSKIAFVQLASTTLLTFFAAPYGLMAIAAAYVGRSYLTLAYELRLFRNEAGIDSRRILSDILPALCATAGMVVAVLLLRLQLSALHCGQTITLIASVCVGLASYAAILSSVFDRQMAAHLDLVMSALPECFVRVVDRVKRRVRPAAPPDELTVLAAFEAAARSADLVTFDVFDTLVERNFRIPTDLFKACEASLRGEQVFNAAGFADHRIRAERDAREEAARLGRREVTLDDIYGCFPASWGPQALSRAKEIELRFELCSVRADELVLEAAKRLIAHGARVVLVSDMYLPKAHIEAVLRRVGLSGFEDLQVSCECGLAKADGSAWASLRRRYGLSSGAVVVHLGDNPMSDGQRAAEAAIKPFLLPAPHARSVRHRLSAHPHWLMGSCESLLLDALRRHGDKAEDESYWITVAHLVALPTALGFCAFIEDATRKNGREPYFLARDGLLFKTVFDAVYRPHGTPPRENYLFASRRCLNVASIEKLDDQALDFLASGVDDLSPVAYLRRIDLDIEAPDVMLQLRRFFGDPYRPIEVSERGRMRDLFRALAPQIEARAALERAALTRYLATSGLFETKASVVDLGWHGSLQRSIDRLATARIGRDLDIDGLYLGTLARPGANRGGDEAMRGWLFDHGDPARTFAATVGKSIEVVELLFSAPHSSVSHMCIEDGQPQPVFVVDANEDHRLRIAALIHDEVQWAARALRPMISLVRTEEWTEIVTRQLAVYLGQPDRSDVARYRAVLHNEGFGVSRYRPIVPARTRSLNPVKLQRYIDASFWPDAARTGLGRHQILILQAANVLRQLKRQLKSGRRKPTLTLTGSNV